MLRRLWDPLVGAFLVNDVDPLRNHTDLLASAAPTAKCLGMPEIPYSNSTSHRARRRRRPQ